MADVENPEGSEVAYSLGNIFHVRLGKLMEILSNTYLAEDIEGHYKTLRELFLNCEFSIKQDADKEELKEQIRVKLNKENEKGVTLYQKIYFKQQVKDKYGKITKIDYPFRSEAWRDMEEIRNVLYGLMYYSNLIINVKEYSKVGLSGLKKRYGLFKKKEKDVGVMDVKDI